MKFYKHNLYQLAVVALVFLVLLPITAYAADGVVVTPIRIDFTPLIPVINGMIVTVAGLLSAAVPVIVGYGVLWLRQHGIAMSAAAQKTISDRIGATIQNGIKYAQSGADVGISKLKVEVSDPAIANAANYAMKQSPDLLKKAGIDITTEEGQQTLIRRIVAESQPTPPNSPPTLDVNVKQG